MSASQVVAVVVNYNAGEHLARCVSSLRAAGVDDVRVADNESVDDSLARLRLEDKQADIVRTGANLGYGGGANRAGLGTKAEYLLVCNADVQVQADTVAQLVQALDEDPAVGMVGPRIENVDGSLYPSARTFPNLIDAFGHAALGLVLPHNRFTRRYRMLDWDHHAAADVDWVSGACFVIRGALFDGLGGFDESYFMYLEDVDLCWRVWRAGWRVRYQPDAVVVHVQGVSTDQTPYRMLVAHHRSMLRFAWRTTTGWRRALLPVVTAGLAGRLLVAVAHRGLVGRRRPPAKSSVPAAAPGSQGGEQVA